MAKLFRTHAKGVARLLRFRLRSDSDAQDATQEVFLRLHRQEQTGNLKEEATGYMHATVHSVTVDTLRRRTSHGYLREVSLDGADDAAEGDGYSAATSIANEAAQLPHHAAPQDEALFWREGVAKLVDTLRELPEVTQQVFILYHFEGLSHQQIVHRLGVPLRSVERHMAKALAYCRERLGDYL